MTLELGPASIALAMIGTELTALITATSIGAFIGLTPDTPVASPRSMAAA